MGLSNFLKKNKKFLIVALFITTILTIFLFTANNTDAQSQNVTNQLICLKSPSGCL